MSSLDEYRVSLEASRRWFQEQHPNVGASFQLLDTGFGELGKALQTGRDANNKTHVGLIPLLLVLQRQSFVALDAISSAQAYQAWVLVRPGIESGLVMGKWVDDLANYKAWLARRDDPVEYRKRYTGKALKSVALPYADRLQKALSAINDNFVHPNPFYVFRHTRVNDLPDKLVEIRLQFFDDNSFHWASVLALLHLLVTLQDAIARMFAALFVNIEIVAEHFGLADFRELHVKSARKALDAEPVLYELLVDIGLWDLAGIFA
jgi:hypothetical protein